MTYSKNKAIKYLSILLVVLSIILRIISILHSNLDLATFNLAWYETLYKEGIGKTLGTNFANYTPPYTYLLALATFTHDLLPPLVALKLIPTCFDIFGAICIFKIVKLNHKQGTMPYLAAAIYFSAPTVIINSSYWGQVDSVYTAFLLVCLYALLTKKPFISILAFGVAFSIKAQAIFFLPFLVVMALRKRIPWLYFGWVPIVYFIAVMPVVLLGRPLLETLLIYTNQSRTFNVLSMNGPNLYFLFSNDWYTLLLPIGIVTTIILLSYWVYTTAKTTLALDTRNILLLAFISTVLTPFLLPKMHDRYFYPADILSIVLAFYWPTLWFVPILYQIISGMAISGFLFNIGDNFIVIAVLLNTITLATVLQTQRQAENRAEINQKLSGIFSRLVTILTPVVLLNVSISFLLTSYFIKFEYSMPYFPADQQGFGKSERFHWAASTFDYLTNDKQIGTLTRLVLDNGTPVFNHDETSTLENLKSIIQNIFSIWRLALLSLFILGLLAWLGNWLPAFRHGIRQGGWFAVWISIAFGIAVIIGNTIYQNNYFQNFETLTQLFPSRFLLDLFLFTALGMGTSGFILAMILKRLSVPE